MEATKEHHNLSALRAILKEIQQGQLNPQSRTIYFSNTLNNSTGLVIPPISGQSLCISAFSITTAVTGANGLQWLQGNAPNGSDAGAFYTYQNSGTRQPGLFYISNQRTFAMSVKYPEYIFRTTPGMGLFLFATASSDNAGFVTFWVEKSINR